MEGTSSPEPLEQSVLNTLLGPTTYRRIHGNETAGAFGSGVAIG